MVCEVLGSASNTQLLPVLILVLMEYGLRAYEMGNVNSILEEVLILVLMEYGLRGSNL